MNERYGKNTAPGGKTRKSAAAAKPKRPTATGSSASKSSKTTTGKGAAGKGAPRERINLHPPTPEYRFWRRIWLGLMITAMALVAASWYLMQNKSQYGLYVLIAAYVVLGVGLFVDFAKMRRLRLDYHAAAGKQPAAKSAAAEKPKADDAESSSDNDKS